MRIPILIFGAFFIESIRCYSYDGLSETLRSNISSKMLEFAQFNLATRTDCQERKEEIPLNQLIDSENGREELKAIDEYIKSVIKSAVPANLRSGNCEMVRGIYGDECLGDVGKRYTFDQGHLFIKEFSNQLSSGYLLRWPRYCYDKSFQKPRIFVEPEEITLEKQSYRRIDWGPDTPKFDKLQDLKKKYDIYNSSDLFGKSAKWVPGTPLKDQNPDFYKLYHVIPMPVLVSLYDLFSTVWHKMDDGKRQMLSAPLRVLNRTAEAGKLIMAGRRLNSQNFDYDYEALKEQLSQQFNFDYEPKKILFWAPGNLYYGYVNFLKTEEEFSNEVQLIIGQKRFKKAEKIYNHILDFLDRVGYPITSKHNVDQETIANKIFSDASLLAEMKEIFFKVIYFGQDRNEPYPIDVDLWESEVIKDKGLWVWKIIPVPESQNYYEPEDSVPIDNRISKALMMQETCHFIKEKSFRKRRSIVVSQDEYLTFGDSELRNLMTNESDIGKILLDYSKKHSDTTSITLSKLNSFVRNESINYYSHHGCTERNWLCSRVESTCDYEDLDDSILMCDENSEPKNRKCPPVEISRRGYIASPSFPDWCDGKRYENQNQITTDSVVLRILTFNEKKSNRLNKKILVDLYDEYSNKTNSEGFNFVDYLEDQIGRYNTTASRILNRACKAYKEPAKELEAPLTIRGFFKEMCELPTNLFAASYCIADKILFGLPTAYFSMKIKAMMF